MKLLFDECLPRKLKNSFSSHECLTVPEAGFAGKTNGELLKLAESEGFDIFLTVDQGIEYEQNLKNRTIAILLLRARSSRLTDVLPLVVEIHKALSEVQTGAFVRIGR